MNLTRKLLIFSLIMFVFCFSIVFAAQIEKKNLIKNNDLLINSIINTKIINSVTDTKTINSIIDTKTINSITNDGSTDIKNINDQAQKIKTTTYSTELEANKELETYSNELETTKPTFTDNIESKCTKGYNPFTIEIKEGDNFISFLEGTDLTKEIEKELLSKLNTYEYSSETKKYSIVKDLKINTGYVAKSDEEFKIQLCKTCEQEDYNFELNKGAGWYLIPGPYSPVQKIDLIKQQISKGPYILENGKYKEVNILEPGKAYWVMIGKEIKLPTTLKIENVCERARPTTTIPISTCINITTPGEYELVNNIIHTSLYPSDICILISSDNVTFDCKQFDISSNVTPPMMSSGDNRIGISVIHNYTSDLYSSISQPLRNILIQNCEISKFSQGIKVESFSRFNNENVTLLNNYLSTNRKSGIAISGSSNILIKDNIAMFNSHGISFYGNSSFGDGLNHTIEGNILINNSDGINANFIKNSSFNNNYIGGKLIDGTKGIFLFETEKNNITNNYIKNTENGIYIFNPYLGFSYASNNFNNNFVEKNTEGYYIADSRGNIFKNETANNNWIGININGGNNFFYNTTTKNNSIVGIRIEAGWTAKFHDKVTACYNGLDINNLGSATFLSPSELMCNTSNPISICATALPCEPTITDLNLTGLLIYDLIDNDWADRDRDNLTCFEDSEEDYSPFTNGIGDCIGPDLMRRYGSEYSDYLLDNDVPTGLFDITEKQNIWIEGKSMYQEDGAPYLDIRSVAYSIKFMENGTGEETGIPVCQGDDGTDDFSYCVRTGTEDPFEEIVMERPQIYFLGSIWILLDMQPPAEGGSQANTNYREYGGEITLAKEASYGILSVGEQLTTEDYYVQLDDVSVGVGTEFTHPAIVSLIDKFSGLLIEQTEIHPGETEDMGPADEVRVHIYKTSPGITYKWAGIAILSDVLVLEDGDSVDDDENEDWYIRLAWKNKEGDASLTSDTLREIILHNTNSFDLEEGETFNIIENPAAFEMGLPGFYSGNTTRLTFEFDNADLVECGTGAILNPSRDDQMWAHITTEDGEFESTLSSGESGPEIFVALKDGTVTGGSIVHIMPTLDFMGVWVYDEIGDCVNDMAGDSIMYSSSFNYNPAGEFGWLHIGADSSSYPESIQFVLKESVGPVDSTEDSGEFIFVVYNERGNWQYQIRPLDEDAEAAYLVTGFLPSSDPLLDINTEVEDNFVSLRGTNCDFSNDKYTFEIPKEVLTLEPSIEPIIPEEEPSESSCTIRDKWTELRILAGPRDEEIEMRKGEIQTIWSDDPHYNITVTEIGIELGDVNDTCEYCPVLNKQITLRIEDLSTHSTTPWTAHEDDAIAFGGGELTIIVNDIGEIIGPAEPCCEECNWTYGWDTTLLYIGDNISVDEYYVHLADIDLISIGEPEPFNKNAIITIYNSTGGWITQESVSPLNYYEFTVPTGTINVSVCKTKQGLVLTEEWACVNATFIPEGLNITLEGITLIPNDKQAASIEVIDSVTHSIINYKRLEINESITLLDSTICVINDIGTDYIDFNEIIKLNCSGTEKILPLGDEWDLGNYTIRFSDVAVPNEPLIRQHKEGMVYSILNTATDEIIYKGIVTEEEFADFPSSFYLNEVAISRDLTYKKVNYNDPLLTNKIIEIGETVPFGAYYKLRFDDVDIDNYDQEALLKLQYGNETEFIHLDQGESYFWNGYNITIDKVAGGYTLTEKWVKLNVSSTTADYSLLLNFDESSGYLERPSSGDVIEEMGSSILSTFEITEPIGSLNIYLNDISVVNPENNGAVFTIRNLSGSLISDVDNLLPGETYTLPDGNEFTIEEIAPGARLCTNWVKINYNITETIILDARDEWIYGIYNITYNGVTTKDSPTSYQNKRGMIFSVINSSTDEIIYQDIALEGESYHWSGFLGSLDFSVNNISMGYSLDNKWAEIEFIGGLVIVNAGENVLIGSYEIRFDDIDIDNFDQPAVLLLREGEEERKVLDQGDSYSWHGYSITIDKVAGGYLGISTWARMTITPPTGLPVTRVFNVTCDIPSTEHPCISNCTNITEPGYYELCGNISAVVGLGETCIDIQTNNVTLNGMNFSIVGANVTGGSGTRIEDYNNSLITNLIIKDLAFGFEIKDGAGNNTIFKNNLSNNSWYGILIEEGGENNKILNNNINSSGLIGIYLYYSGKDNSINNNNITASMRSGIAVYGTNFGTLRDNIVKNSGRDGFVFKEMENFQILNNIVSNSSIKGMNMFNCSNNNLTNNIIFENGGAGILLSVNCTNNTITNSELGPNNTFGLLVQSNSSHNRIEGNMIQRNSQDGIQLNNCYVGNQIIGNNIRQNQRYGIFLLETTETNIRGNSVTANLEEGIFLSQSCRNNIGQTFINSNNGKGIWLEWNSSQNTIIQNNISNNNDTGLFIDNTTLLCENNHVYHNYIIENGEYGMIIFGLGNDVEGNIVCDNNQSTTGSYEDVYDGGTANIWSETTCDTSFPSSPSGLCNYSCTSTPAVEPFNCTLIPEMEPVVRGLDVDVNIICKRAGVVVDCPEMEWIPDFSIHTLPGGPDYYMFPHFHNTTSTLNTDSGTSIGSKIITAKNMTNGTRNGFCTANIQVIERSSCNPWTVKLDSGYNTISIPIDPSTTSPSILFPGLDVWIFNNSIADWQIATEIEAGRGYIIYATEPEIFTIYGIPKDTYDKPLGFSELDNEGWHLVGVSCENISAINSLLAETPDHVFHCYNTGTGEYKDETTISIGQSCFIIRS